MRGNVGFPKGARGTVRLNVGEGITGLAVESLYPVSAAWAPDHGHYREFPELERVRDRVLFGSDWPSSPSVSRLAREFEQLPFSRELVEGALWRNASRLFGLPTTEAPESRSEATPGSASTRVEASG